MTLIIDSHQHFFNPDLIHYCWMKPDMPIAKTFLPSDLKPLLAKNKVDKTVLVQAADVEAENGFLFGLAAENDFIAGVVAWLDMDLPDFAEKLENWMKQPKFLGLRPMIEAIEDDAWMLRPNVKRAFALLEEREVCFDFLTHPRHLPHALVILKEFPKLRAVIDHISKPKIRDREFHPWADLMAEVAAHKNVHCKVSGMITEAAQGWTPDDLGPYIEHVLKQFGPGRCMFGSDWPVCLLAGSYDQVVDALKKNLGGLNDKEMEAVFGETARKFYRI